MRHATLSPLLFALVAAALPQAAAAQGTMADQFARLQDFSASPPTIDPYLDHLLYWLSPNDSLAHLSGPPFPSPGPWHLPPDLWSYSGFCKSGSEEIGSAPRCVRSWSECFVTLVFTDGSRYSYEATRTGTVCSDGSADSFEKRSQVAELGPPSQRDWLVHVESWTHETLETRRNRVSGRSGAVADYRARAGAPVVTSGPFELDLGPGGVLDLRQNAAASGPLFLTDGPALLRCDTVLLDPGVTLVDLFAVPPIVQPGALVGDVDLPLAPYVASRSGAPFQAPVIVRNTGNVDQVLQASWSGPFCAPGSTVVTLGAHLHVELWIPCQIPPGTPVGAVAATQVQVVSQTTPGLSASAEVLVANQHPGVFRFGSGTPGCLGAHGVDVDGPVAAGGPVVALTVGANNPFGIGLWLVGDPVGGNWGTLTVPGLADLYVDPFAPWFVTEFYVADAAGTAALPLQVANDPDLRGLELVCQPVGLWLGPCNPGVLTFSSGPALGLVVQ